jgi:toxin ParE1/3/4
LRLVWSPHALSDRDDIFTYIEAHSPRAAGHVDEQISAAIHRLAEFPESGRPGRVTGTRELIVPRTPYIAAYTFGAGTMRILRILHGAQIWPEEFDSE